MEAPYIIAKVHKATSTSDLHIYTGPTFKLGSRKPSSREVVAAIDSQGINVYNIRSSQLVTSYSLSPATRFHCAPISVLDRISSTRTTYAALQTGADQLRIQRWTESGTGIDAQDSIFEIKKKARGLHYTSNSLLVLYEDGELQMLSHDLKSSLQTIILLSSDSKGFGDHIFLNNIRDGRETCKMYIITNGRTPCVLRLSLHGDELKPEGQLTSMLIDVESDEQSRKFAIGADGQLVMLRCSAKHIEAVFFDDVYSQSSSFRISSLTGAQDLSQVSLRWIANTQIVVCTPSEVSLWDALYETCLATTTLDESTYISTVIPQKTLEGSLHQAAYLVTCSVNNIYLAQLSFSKGSSLSNAIGSRAKKVITKTSDTWLQDVEMQSTWKTSLSSLIQSNKKCLNALRRARTGVEFDDIFERFLTGSVTGKPVVSEAIANEEVSATQGEQQTRAQRRNKQRQQRVQAEQTVVKANAVASDTSINGHHSIQSNHELSNGLSTTVEPIMDTTQVQEAPVSVYPTRKSFEISGIDANLSVPFVDQMMQVIANGALRETIPLASIDYLLKKKLIPIAEYDLSSAVWAWLRGQQADLKLRFMSESIGLLPEQVIDLLHTFMRDKANLSNALSIAMVRLDPYDEVLVTMAIRSKLTSEEIDMFMGMLNDELRSRLSESRTSTTLSGQDEVLCASITNFIDALGVSNLMLSSSSKELLDSLRISVAQVIALDEYANATASCLSELLFKARLLEPTSLAKEDNALENNPQPRANSGRQALDRIKKVEKGQTRRAKAYARVQGIGSVYTIETLQI